MSRINPILVEVTRGEQVESEHRGAVAVVNAAGQLVRAIGDVERPVYARSAIKPLQAMALAESGALEHYELGLEALALACASHGGEPMHVQRLQAWLERLGLSESDLECGPQAPSHGPSRHALLQAQGTPGRLHNNCSGKHAGFLTTCVYYGEPTQGYLQPQHPSQQRWRTLLAELSASDLSAMATGIDGCGIPVIALSLQATALAMARLARPDSLPPSRAAAAQRIHQAMATHPLLVAGTGRFCSRVIAATQGVALVKTGAEGVFTAMLPEQGLGVALKIDDGGTRAAEVAMGALLDHLGLLTPASRATLADSLQPAVLNRAGRTVGVIRPVASVLNPTH